MAAEMIPSRTWSPVHPPVHPTFDSSSHFTALMDTVEPNLWLCLATPENFSKDVDINGLADSALKSFSVIEPWRLAQRS